MGLWDKQATVYTPKQAAANAGRMLTRALDPIAESFGYQSEEKQVMNIMKGVDMSNPESFTAGFNAIMAVSPEAAKEFSVQGMPILEANLASRRIGQTDKQLNISDKQYELQKKKLEFEIKNAPSKAAYDKAIKEMDWLLKQMQGKDLLQKQNLNTLNNKSHSILAEYPEGWWEDKTLLRKALGDIGKLTEGDVSGRATDVYGTIQKKLDELNISSQVTGTSKEDTQKNTELVKDIFDFGFLGLSDTPFSDKINIYDIGLKEGISEAVFTKMVEDFAKNKETTVAAVIQELSETGKGKYIIKGVNIVERADAESDTSSDSSSSGAFTSVPN